MNNQVKIVCLAGLLLAFFTGLKSGYGAPRDRNADSILVGVEYFAGWWPETPNKWEYPGDNWLKDFPGRTPLLGLYNNQQTMNREIEAAATYGVDFFSILWYYGNNAGGTDKAQAAYLNRGLDLFMKSSKAHLMKFMIEVTNHPPFAIITDEDWERSMEIWISAMKHPSYLRVDGRAVIKIHAGYNFFYDLNSDTGKCRQLLLRMREMAKEAGVGDLLIVAGLGGRETPLDEDHFMVQIGEFDCTMQYMDVPDLPQKKTSYPYEKLVRLASETRRSREQDVLPSVPYLPVGWDPRPWRDKRPGFSAPRKAEWRKALAGMKNDLLQSENLGFPNRDNSVTKAFTIYAWNEFGEGGFLAPTRGEKYMKLKQLKKIFR